MPGTHGDLYRDIGRLVVAAHGGRPIDLKTESELMAERYRNLGLPAELLAKAIARSLSAISVSMQLVPTQAVENGASEIDVAQPENEPISLYDGAPAPAPISAEERAAIEGPAKKVSRLFPSGLRLGLLS